MAGDFGKSFIYLHPDKQPARRLIAAFFVGPSSRLIAGDNNGRGAGRWSRSGYGFTLSNRLRCYEQACRRQLHLSRWPGLRRISGADVNFSINASQGVHSISPYIYGTNQFNTSTPPVNLGLQRLGGNRWTGYNWETNYSNAGTDYLNNSDLYLTNGQVLPAGGALRLRFRRRLRKAMRYRSRCRSRATLLPMATAGKRCASCTVSRWKQVVAKKSSIAWPARAFDNAEFQRRLRVYRRVCILGETHEAAGQQVFYTLDNEPGLWDDTHPRIHPNKATFAEMRDKTIATRIGDQGRGSWRCGFRSGRLRILGFVDLNGPRQQHAAAACSGDGQNALSSMAAARSCDGRGPATSNVA